MKRRRARSFTRNPERDLARRLRGLDLGQGPVVIEPIAGGLSNRNFAVNTAESAYVARLCEPRPLLGIDRRNEVVCQQAASRRGIAPEIVHHEDGLLVSRFIDGQTLDAAQVRAPEMIARLGSLLRELHGAWDGLIGEMLYFCPFQTVRTYADTAMKLGAELPSDLSAILDDTRELASRFGPFRPVLCHNDLMPANLIDAGAHLWLVDWEYSGVGNPLFDLANASANAGFQDQDDHLLLEAYRGQVNPSELGALRILKAVSLFRESLWSVIQTVASEIEFDYRRYAADNLVAYRQARARLVM
jgi:thiamine kinase-like enzyme